MAKVILQLAACIALLPGVCAAQVRDADSYQPINEIRSIESLTSGARATTRARADRLLGALTELTVVRPFPLKLDDGVTIWRVESLDAGEFQFHIADKPCLDWKAFADRFGAKLVLSPHWTIFEAKGPYFSTTLKASSRCVSTFTIKVI